MIVTGITREITRRLNLIPIGFLCFAITALLDMNNQPIFEAGYWQPHFEHVKKYQESPPWKANNAREKYKVLISALKNY